MIFKRINPLLPLCLFMLTLVCMDGVSALCLERRVFFGGGFVCKFGRYPSTQSFPLSLISPGPSEVAVLPHTLTAISIAFRRLSGWVCREAKALPGPLAVLGACVIEWLEWAGAKDNKGEKYKDMGRWYDNTPPSPPHTLPLFHSPFHLPITFPSVHLSVLPPDFLAPSLSHTVV